MSVKLQTDHYLECVRFKKAVQAMSKCHMEITCLGSFHDDLTLTLKARRQSRLQQTTNFVTSFLILEKNKV